VYREGKSGDLGVGELGVGSLFQQILSDYVMPAAGPAATTTVVNKNKVPVLKE
jgi:hypothetical protein